MKAVSILVFLALLIIPHWVLISYFISQILTKGVKGIESSRPSPKLDRFKSQYKSIFYLLLLPYYFALFVALCWVIYETTSGWGVFYQLAIAGVSLFFVMMVAYLAWLNMSIERLLKKFPRPEADFSSKEYLEWQNKIMDETYSQYSTRILFRNWGIACGIVLLVFGLLGLVAYFTLK